MTLPQNPTFSGFPCCLIPVSSQRYCLPHICQQWPLRCLFLSDAFTATARGVFGGQVSAEVVEALTWWRKKLMCRLASGRGNSFKWSDQDVSKISLVFRRYCYCYFSHHCYPRCKCWRLPRCLCCLRTLLLLPPPSHHGSHTYNEPSIYHDISIKVSSHTTFAFTMSYIFGKLMHQRSIKAIWKPY